MTANQLRYWQNVETHRNNAAVEAETYRSNYAREQENIRSNLAREVENNRHNTQMESETKRANRAQERIAYSQMQSSRVVAAMNNSAAYNRALLEANLRRQQYANQLAIAQLQVAETSRANQAREAEQAAQRLSNERIEAEKARISQFNAQTSYANAQTQRSAQIAEERYGLMSLEELQRANLEKENELLRSHLAEESLKQRELYETHYRNTETARANRAQEELAFQRNVIDATGNQLQFISSMANAGSRLLGSGRRGRYGR